MEVGFAELNEWAEKVADKTNPEELWDTLVDTESRVSKLELKQESTEETGPDPCRACTMGSEDSSRLEVLEAKIRTMEGFVSESHDEVRHQGKSPTKMTRKPISEDKVIQNIAPLTDDKSKFREWNRKLVNALGQVDGKCETALALIMKLADADSLPDLDQWQTVAQRVISQIGDFDSDQFDRDLRNVLVEKAVGTVHTKVNNGLTKGGVFVYVDIYKHFTETSPWTCSASTQTHPARQDEVGGGANSQVRGLGAEMQSSSRLWSRA